MRFLKGRGNAAPFHIRFHFFFAAQMVGGNGICRLMGRSR